MKKSRNSSKNKVKKGKLRSMVMISATVSPAKPTEVYNTYWQFATERQEIFFRRLEGQPFPWTKDTILTKHKFTNAYRASDRVSQYLIQHIIYNGDQSPVELFFRILLFKIFNSIKTWHLLEQKLGSITYKDYSFKKYDQILESALKCGSRIFSAAYIMPSGGAKSIYKRKHQAFLRLIERMISDELPIRIQECKSMKKGFELLRSYPMIGDFLAYQYITDINYSQLTNFSEMEFVIPGPGAKDGIRKCFSDYGGFSEIDLIRLVADRQLEEIDQYGLKFRNLWGRPLQLIDCQNLFCEVSKYSRIAHPHIKGTNDRIRIKQIFKPSGEKLIYFYPPKWNINSKVKT